MVNCGVFCWESGTSKASGDKGGRARRFIYTPRLLVKVKVVLSRVVVATVRIGSCRVARAHDGGAPQLHQMSMPDDDYEAHCMSMSSCLSP
jgi:hypothetical protein